jgi:uncharacterized membrane protein
VSPVFDPSWWFSSIGPIAPWWAACALLGLLALPLTLRAFAPLADRGAGLSLGVGIFLTTWIAWVPAHFGVPHGAASIRAALLIVAAASGAAWWRSRRQLAETLRAVAAPFVIAQILFAVGFVYFCNVRSYLPAATSDPALSGAEKLGNLMHLNGVMRATTMPPPDPWLLGEPSNYYYGGHLLVGTLAKLTGTPARYAFNYGLATTFALTLAMGFSLAYSMVVRRGPRAPRRGIAWPRGLAWGLLGASAIGLFGNLDAWRQLGRRDPFDVVREVQARLDAERWSTRSPARRAAIDREQAALAARQEQTRERARWSWGNLQQIDYWASSRAIRGGAPEGSDPGTITEFPYFSALLGDLHPHHLALPLTIAALAATLALLRANAAGQARDDRGWAARCAVPALVMGIAIGAVFPVNIWDSIVLGVLYLLALVASRQGVVSDPRWRTLVFPIATFVLCWLLALTVNIWARVPALGSPILLAAGLALAALGPGIASRVAPDRLPADTRRASIHAGAVMVAAGGVFVGLATPDIGGFDALAAGVRDGLLFEGAAWIASRLAARESQRLSDAVAALGLYAGMGGVALGMAAPFLLHFRSPLGTSIPLLASAFPPRLSARIVSDEDELPLVYRLWMASPINPFAPELRSELADSLAHWGLFVLPLAIFVVYLLVRTVRRDPTTVWVLVGLAPVTLGVTWVAMQGYWVAPIALTLALTCTALVLVPRARLDVPVLVFAATGFFWSWFVEALHFDDSYGGTLERYNTPFKIFYPLWPTLAVAALGALRRMAPRVPRRAMPLLAVVVSPGVLAMAFVAALVGGYALGLRGGLAAAGIAVAVTVLAATLVQVAGRFIGRGVSSDAPACAAGALLALLGLLYPFAATLVRTRAFFTQSIAGTPMAGPDNERVPEFYTRRTLDALAWIGQTRRSADDLPAIEWLLAHGPAGAVVLEAPGNKGAYTPEGRVSSATGLPTLVGWTHHENQWRGWTRPMPLALQRRLFDELTTLLPKIELGTTLSQSAQVELYRASLESPEALIAGLRQALPSAEARALAEHARSIVAARQRALTAVILIQKLHERMAELLAAPVLDDETRRLLRLYKIRYVFAGTLERAAFAEGLPKFAAFPKVFSHGGTAIYEVPPDPGDPANIPGS